MSVKTISWKIAGLRCTACTRTIEARLVREPGVRHVDVSYPAGTARILLDSQAADLDDVRGLLEQAGYRIEPGEAAT